MAIQYAGGPAIVNSTMASPLGTRAELAQWVRDQLVAAGWTSVGTATDYQLTSATTPQGLAGRVRSYDPGTGNCARLKWSNPAGTKTQAGDLFLLPAAAKSWRIVANRYQFFVMAPGVTGPRDFACGGVPQLPSFLNTVVTEAIWGQCASQSDTDATVRASWRTRLDTGNNNACNQFMSTNGSAWELNGSFSSGPGNQKFAPPWSAWSSFQQAAYRWHDDSIQVVEPLIAWGATAQADEAKFRGQLWDAVLMTDAFAADATITLDGRTFWAVTGSNAGVTQTNAPGTLFVAVT